MLNGAGVTVVDGVTGQTVSRWTAPPPFAFIFQGQPSMAFSGSNLVLADAGTLWVSSVQGSLSLATTTCYGSTGLALDGAVAFVACPIQGVIDAVSLGTGALSATQSVSQTPMTGIVAAGGYGYFPVGNEPTLGRLALPGLYAAGGIPFPSNGVTLGGGTLGAMAVVGSTLWVASAQVGELWPVPLATRVPGTAVILPSSAVSIAGEGGVVWVALASGGLAEVGQPA
ncbi:MAG: hypothetical protein B7Z69_05560, partial [Actinobacteria bacterium 21-73-9]